MNDTVLLLTVNEIGIDFRFFAHQQVSHTLAFVREQGTGVVKLPPPGAWVAPLET